MFYRIDCFFVILKTYIITTNKEYSNVFGSVKSGSNEAPFATDIKPVSEFIINLSLAPFCIR